MTSLRVLPFFFASVLAPITIGCAASTMLGRSVAASWSTPAPAPVHVAYPVRHDARVAVTWIGHASVLVQIDDKFVLTDPVFTDTVGGVSKRLVQPGLSPSELPRIDVVAISHVHFDHLSYGSLDAIASRVGRMVVPRGGLVYVPNMAFPVDELARWKGMDVDGLHVTAVPVKHVGFRYGADAAWAREGFTGWVFEYHGITVYFGGDTAYEPAAFDATAKRFPSIDLALIPIAPIEPRGFMKATHVDGREAILAFERLHAKHMVPIHHGTFINSTDEPGDALRVLGEAMKERGVGGDRVPVVPIGGQFVLRAAHGFGAGEEKPGTGTGTGGGIRTGADR
ncbi:MAG: MBL fold metallo-hydrolase [Polyangiaceae bacterium]